MHMREFQAKKQKIIFKKIKKFIAFSMMCGILLT
jgi:hypothetical protein